MNVSSKKDHEITPDIVRRTGGGWLAVAPKGALLSLGVTANTEDELRAKFRSVFTRWVERYWKQPNERGRQLRRPYFMSATCIKYGEPPCAPVQK